MTAAARDADVLVVGAGLGGLLTAAELARRGVDVAVVDEGERPGGVTRSRAVGGYRMEPAAGTLMLPHPVLSRILDFAGAETRPVGPLRRWVFTGRRLVELPAGPRAALAPVVPWTAKLSALAEAVRPVGADDDDESLSAFLSRRFGTATGRFLSAVMAAGVFAGDPDRLSAGAAFPALTELEREGSILRGAVRRMRAGGVRPRTHVPVGGTSRLTSQLAAILGDRFRAGFAVGSVRRDGEGWCVEGPQRLAARAVVLAVSPRRAAALLDGEIAATLRRAVSAPVAVVGLGGRSDRLPLPAGFGYLAGPGTGLVGVGCLFESWIDPARAPDGRALAKVIAGGATTPDVVEWDDDRLVTRVGEELAMALGADVEAEQAEVIRHRPGIPQYEVGHTAWLRAIDRLLSDHPGLHLTGWGYRGVGVAHLAVAAGRVADRLDGSG